jgi:hypothetical protein
MNAVRAGIVLSRLMTTHHVADMSVRISEQEFVYLLPTMGVSLIGVDSGLNRFSSASVLSVTLSCL